MPCAGALVADKSGALLLTSGGCHLPSSVYRGKKCAAQVPSFLGTNALFFVSKLPVLHHGLTHETSPGSTAFLVQRASVYSFCRQTLYQRDWPDGLE